MDKPATILRQEFIEKQIELINGSGLPAFVLVDIMEETIQELRRLAKEQYLKDKQAWDEHLNEQKEKKNKFDISDEEREAILNHYNKTIVNGEGPTTE